MRKVAIVLFNLGGPDCLAAVRPFLFNLFKDRAIIDLPAFLRLPLAWAIASGRARLARENYAAMGGASPLRFETEAQAAALQLALSRRSLAAETHVFIAMRYWTPLAPETAALARAWGADEAVLLPLYPQFSSTTTASAMAAWADAWRGPTRTLCCFPTTAGLIDAHAAAILSAWRKAGAPERPRVLFSAHGLPQRTVDRGDPYAWQVEQTARAVAAKLPGEWRTRLCYQSRVGPLKWLGPATEEEIRAAGADKAGVIVSPIAFVSEHVETLIELDRDYAALAKAEGLPFYIRAPALGAADAFIAALGDHIERLLAAPPGVYSESGARICPRGYRLCPLPVREDP
jgi:ferrochelatase